MSNYISHVIFGFAMSHLDFLLTYLSCKSYRWRHLPIYRLQHDSITQVDVHNYEFSYFDVQNTAIIKRVTIISINRCNMFSDFMVLLKRSFRATVNYFLHYNLGNQDTLSRCLERLTWPMCHKDLLYGDNSLSQEIEPYLKRHSS